MKASELREKTFVELKQILVKLHREYFNLRMQKGMGEKPKPHVFRIIKKKIARLETALSEKRRLA